MDLFSDFSLSKEVTALNNCQVFIKEEEGLNIEFSCNYCRYFNDWHMHISSSLISSCSNKLGNVYNSKQYLSKAE